MVQLVLLLAEGGFAPNEPSRRSIRSAINFPTIIFGLRSHAPWYQSTDVDKRCIFNLVNPPPHPLIIRKLYFFTHLRLLCNIEQKYRCGCATAWSSAKLIWANYLGRWKSKELLTLLVAINSYLSCVLPIIPLHHSGVHCRFGSCTWGHILP